MKPIFILILICCIQVHTQVQGQGISLNIHNTSLQNVFRALTKRTGVLFFYTEGQLKGVHSVTIHVENATLDEALKMCFANQPIDYRMVNNTVVIMRRPAAQFPDSLRNLHGIVTASGNPLAGASVFIKDAARGAVTDASGNFTLVRVPENALLVCTSVGYQPVEIDPGDEASLHIEMKTQMGILDQTIIIGYGTTTARMNTGSVSKVSSEDLSKRPVTNPLLSLEGRVPGLYLSATSGTPGAQVTFRLRGTNSLRPDGNDPLFIVDGVPFPSSTLSPFLSGGAGQNLSPFNQLNVGDIESIEILKDADATAIYGSRGANGVVLITTKKGRQGKVMVDVGTFSGVGKIPKKMSLMNTQQYLAMRHEAFFNDGATPQPSDYDLTRWDTTRYTDWQEVFVGGVSQINQTQASVSGGNNRTQFRISGTYHRETTVFPGPFSDRKMSTRFSIQHSSSNQRLSIGLTGSYLAGRNILPEMNFASLINLAPDAPPLYDGRGNLNWADESWINPLAYLQEKHNNHNSNLLGNLDLGYKFSKNIRIRLTGGYNKVISNDLTLSPKTIYAPSLQSSSENISNAGNNDVETWISEPQIHFDKKILNHRINILAGTTFQLSRQNNLALRGTGFSSEQMMNDLAAAKDIHVVGVNKTRYTYNAFFARFNYTYKDRYILNLTGRRDGSSRFAPGRRYANFGAAGAAWIFSSESFIKKTIPWLSFGKLRTSYGLTGSDQIGDYGYLNTYSPNSIAYDDVAGIVPSALFNANYSWETSRKTEAGVEFGLLHNRILLTVDYYRNISSNQLVGLSLPAMTGFTTIQDNLDAVVRNSGTELELTAKLLEQKSFSWLSSLNISIPRNKLVSYPGIELSSYSATYVVGKSLYIQPYYHVINVDAQTGLYQFADLNKDGAISYPDDIIGRKENSQRYYGGVKNTWKYKSWQLDIFIEFVKQTSYSYLTQFAMPGQYQGWYGNQPVSILSRWTKPGDITCIQMFSQGYGDAFSAHVNNTYTSDNLFADASFTRIKNLTLSYTLPHNALIRLGVQKLQLFVLGQNLLTFTQYKGYDPQANAPGTTIVPPLRTLTAGLNLTL